VGFRNAVVVGENRGRAAKELRFDIEEMRAAE
jgi:hypothetical protein